MDHRAPFAGLLALLQAACLILLLGCQGKEETAAQPPVPILPGDECHLCGMIIRRFPGPKGEAYVKGSEQPYKFCSTVDLFAWLLQPENQHRVTAVYVHDMGSTDWDHPDDSAFTDARKAWYVVGHPLKGAMGPTIASFGDREAAEAFARRYGGRMLRFEDIDLRVLAELRER